MTCWYLWAKFRSPDSSKDCPVNCRPMGSPVLSNPTGIEMAGMPARFAVIVKISLKYIDTGSLVFSPSAKAVVGDVGPAM